MTQVDPLLTASQVAQRLTDAGVPTSKEAVRKWATAGKIEFVATPSGRRFFQPTVVDAILRGEHSRVAA